MRSPSIFKEVIIKLNLISRIKKSEVVMSKMQLKRLAKKMRKLEEFAFDTENNTLRVNGPNKDFKHVGISISWGDYDNYYIPTGHYFDEGQLPLGYVVEHLKPVFENPNIRLIGHNLKYDLHVLERIGIVTKTRDLFDTLIASWLIDVNTPNGLKDISERLLNKPRGGGFNDILKTVTKEEKKEYGMKTSKKAPMNLVRIENGAPYALEDSHDTWMVYLNYLHLLESSGNEKFMNKRYKQFLHTLFQMERRGIDVNKARLIEMGEQMDEDMQRLQYEIFELVGIEFNPASRQQLAEILFGIEDPEIYKNPNQELLDVSFQFPIISSTAKGAPQTGADILEKLLRREYSNSRKLEGLEVCRKLLEYSKVSKLKSSFVTGILDNLYDDDKAHPNFKAVGTTSGRISCSNPNLQQLPNAEDDDKYQIRSVFVSNGNKIIASDYDNLEMKILAHFSLDPILVETFEQQLDSHGKTAVEMFELDCEPDNAKAEYPTERRVAKTLNFLLMYGGSAYTLYETLTSQGVNMNETELLNKYGVKDGKALAQFYYDRYFKTYSGVSKFMKQQKRFAHKNGYVQTLTGRFRPLPDINSSDFRKVGYMERLSVNSPIQGSAGDIIMSAQILIEEDERLKELDCFQLLQIHDELVFSCPEENLEEACQIIKHYMEFPFGDDVELNVPLTVSYDIGNSYQEAK